MMTSASPAAPGRLAVTAAAGGSAAAVARATVAGRAAARRSSTGRPTAAARGLPADRLLALRGPGRRLIGPSAARLGQDGVGERKAERPRDENCSLHSPLPWLNAVPGHHLIACLTPPTIEH